MFQINEEKMNYLINGVKIICYMGKSRLEPSLIPYAKKNSR
jgi:hypothetical protein